MRILKTALIVGTFGYIWHLERTIEALRREVDRRDRNTIWLTR